MINTSNLYKQIVMQDGRHFSAQGNIKFADGQQITLSSTEEKSDFMSGGISVVDSTSVANELEIGSCAINKATIVLENFDGRWEKYDFSLAEINLIQLGLRLPDGTTELLNKGIFTVNEPVTKGPIIEVVAQDNMVKFDKQYDSPLSYPTTNREILQDACTRCGVVLATQSFLNDDYVVTSRPADEATTYRDIVSYVAQLAGCWARINNLGELALGWYDFDRFYQDTGHVISGGTFKDYSPTKIISGGTFTNYNPTKILRGGVFRQGLQPPAKIDFLKSRTIAKDDVCITGVQITPEDSNKTTYFKGAQGYVVNIEKNLLAQDNLEQLTASLANKLIGFRFRPMSVSALDDPSVEAGDVALLTDINGSQYKTIISNLTYTINNLESYSADAETQAEKQTVRFSAGAKAVQEANTSTKRQLSAYDLQSGHFSDMAALAMGLYSSDEELADGSKIRYWHDKPTLAESQTIWKMNAKVFVVSNDGGQTWRGMDEAGNMLAKVLTAIGVLADWVKIGGSGINGSLVVRDENDNEMITLDKRGVTMQNGAKLIGGNGVLSKFVFSSGGLMMVGIKTNDDSSGFYRISVPLDYCIPDNFVITEAKIHLRLYPHYFSGVSYYNTSTSTYSTASGWGNPKNIQTQLSVLTKRIAPYSFGYQFPIVDPLSNGAFQNITNDSFGSNLTPAVNQSWNPNSNTTDFGSEYISNDISSLLSAGNGEIVFSPADLPAYTEQTASLIANQNTGMLVANLIVTGYSK